MSDEAGRYTAEHTVMDANLEIRELKHLLVVKDKKIKELEQKTYKFFFIVQGRGFYKRVELDYLRVVPRLVVENTKSHITDR